MRKSLLVVSAFSSAFWSISIIEIWAEDKTLQSVVFLIIGALLYGTAFVLFCLRFFQWLRILKARKIDLSVLNFFDSQKEVKPYQREAWLQAILVFFLPAIVAIPFSILQHNSDSNVAPTVYLLFPLSLLLYALLTKDFEVSNLE